MKRKSNPDSIKFEAEGQIYISYPEVEQQVKRLMYAVHKPSTIVRCFDVESNLLLDEMRLDELFNK